MIEPRHTLPDDEEYKMITDPNNPYGIQESPGLASWTNVYAMGWIRGTYYKALKFAAALRHKGWTDDEIAELIAETVEIPDYRCLQQYHMLTGMKKKLPEDCGSARKEVSSSVT